MIVFNLACDAGHAFEGWFGSAEDFDSQRKRGIVTCPVCGSGEVQKGLSAPRLNLLPQGTPGAGDAPAPGGVAVIDPARRHFAELVRRVIAETEDVGDGFAEEARRIHYKEAPARSIRGVATGAEAKSLVEEGIEVVALPGAVTDKSRLN